MRINKIQSEQNSIFNKKKRSYAFKKRSLLDKKTLNKCSNIFNKYGFCVIDEVIPSKEISAIRDEIIEAQKKINWNSY